uniref:Uncharacterized protein n=1 Tax=Anguilla anguilla TaxID=7936 RepID=A0A0E9WRJ2_ANGAN
MHPSKCLSVASLLSRRVLKGIWNCVLLKVESILFYFCLETPVGGSLEGMEGFLCNSHSNALNRLDFPGCRIAICPHWDWNP